jgi:hypothetical protein
MLELKDKEIFIGGLIASDLPACDAGCSSGRTSCMRTGPVRGTCSTFTPCGRIVSLLESGPKNATSGGVVLLSPARSSWHQFRNHQHRQEVLGQAAKSIGSGVRGDTPNINGETAIARQRSQITEHEDFAPGFFEGKPRSEANKFNQFLNRQTQ